MLSESDGNFLLKIAREAIEKFIRNEKMKKPVNHPAALDEKRGVFCTIYGRTLSSSYTGGASLRHVKKPETKDVHSGYELRGCIGMPYPVMPLLDATISAAASACEDSRFPSLTVNELKGIKIEISVLTEPELVKGPMKEGSIKVGRDGLIIQHDHCSGLLLPQVATEQKWNVEEFLEHSCLKAGLLPDTWKSGDARIYRFQAQIFSD